MKDNLPPLEFQKNPFQQDRIDITELCDIHSGRMLVPMKIKLISGVDGAEIKKESRLKLNEAFPLAAHWWQKEARFAMPDQGKADEYLQKYGVASGLLLGLEWEQLAKEEKLKVLRAWWLNIGVRKFAPELDQSTGEQKGVIH